MDLTKLAIPAFFATMWAERRKLKQRAAGQGPSPVDYEIKDTLASLAMGTGSLILPMYMRRATKELRPFGGRYGKAVAAVAGGAILVTTVADAVSKRARKRNSAAATEPTPNQGIDSIAQTVSRIAGPVAVAATGVAITSTWGYHTSPEQLFKRRFTKARGDGLASFAAAIACWDFVYYWNHRFGHEFRFLWAVHVSHHSSERYNLSTALRQTWADSFGLFVPYFVALFGVSPASIEAARGINLLYQYWIHTDLIKSLGPAEQVFNTASHHRVHHGSNAKYLDRNYGSILISWDRMFNTFQPEEEPVVYGLTKNINTFNPLRIATHEYADIARDVSASDNWADRIGFVVRSPGWAYRRKAELAVNTSAALTGADLAGTDV